MFISSPAGVLRTSSVKLRYKSLKVFQPFCSPILRSRNIIHSVVLWFTVNISCSLAYITSLENSGRMKLSIRHVYNVFHKKDKS